MLKVLNYCFIVCMLHIYSAEAKMMKSSTPNSIKEMVLNIQMGDKSSQIKINKNREYLVNIQGTIKKGELSKKNYDHISKKVDSVFKEKSNSMKFCSRSYIQLLSLEDKKIDQTLSCIGSKTQVSKKMLELLNTVALL